MLQYLFGYGFVLQILAIVVWKRRGADRTWIWIIIFGGVIGALAFFLIEGMPDFRAIAKSFAGPARRKRIAVLRAMILDNPSAGNYEQLGELLVQEKKWKEARDAFNHALTSRTDLLDPFYWRGVAAFELGDYTAAIADFQHVVANDPKYDYSRALCLLGRAQGRSGRVAEATMTFDRLTQTTTAAESLVAAAEFYADQQRYQDANQIIESVLARRATMPSYQKRRDRAFLSRAKRLQRRVRREMMNPAAAAAA